MTESAVSVSRSSNESDPTAPDIEKGAPEPVAESAKAGGKIGKKKTPKAPVEAVPFSALFRYATRFDIALYVIASFAAAGNGVIFPLFAVTFGSLLGELNNAANTNLQASIDMYALYFLIIAIGAGVATFLEIALPLIAAERQIKRVREAFLRTLLRQDQSFYDMNKGSELAAGLTENSLTLVAGIGDRITNSIHYTITFLTGIVVGFVQSWQLTLVMFIAVPLLVIIMGWLKNSTVGFESRIAKSYAKAGDAASESFSNIRTVLAYGGAASEVERYDSHLESAQKSGEGKGFAVGMAVGSMFGLMFFLYGLATIVAGVLILNSRTANPLCTFQPTLAGCFSGSNVIQTLMAVMIGSFSLGQVGPNFAAYASARNAAFKLYAIIDRVPVIDVASDEGQKPAPSSLKGTIEFRNVSFAYPTRPTEKILTNFSVVIVGGTSVAIVGESGSGKSTLMQLVQRFYDPQEGTVLLDGVDVKLWNLASLRNRIGIVSQEPTLFATSIAENIAYGKPTDAAAPATPQEIEDAARAANVHDFISSLPLGYSTTVGTSVSSTQLSGGQRQRCCIARAILRDPVYLLLDEATSALDTTSERIVQAALDSLLSKSPTSSGSRTSLIIAHRLSTVTHADRILVMSRGKIIEDGNHVSLMDREDSVYRRLRRLQDTAAQGTATTRRGLVGTGVSTRPPVLATSVPAAINTSGPAPALHSSASTQSLTGAAAATATVGPAANSQTEPSHAHAPQSSPKAASAAGTPVAAAAAAASKKKVGWGAQSTKEDKELEEFKAGLPTVDPRRVWKLQAPEAHLLAMGLVGSIASGVIQPVFAILWSNVIAVFFSPDNVALKQQTEEYLGWFALIGAAQLGFTVLRIGFFVMAGERLTRRLRTMTFRAILAQEVGFFDDAKNSVGRLSTRLSADAAEVKGGTGEGLSLVLQAGAAIIAGMIIAFVANWRLALVVAAIFPLMVLTSLLQGQAFKGYAQGAAKSMEESGHIAVEATAAIRTVAAFNLQNSMIAAFSRSLDIPLRAGYGKAMSAGVGQAFCQFILFAGYSLAFYAGGQFIVNGWLTFAQLMRVFLALTMSAQAAGNAITWGPNKSKADRATRSIFNLLDRKPAIDNLSTGGITPQAPMSGTIEFKNVSFKYPSRPDAPVLRDVSITIKMGQKIALVGPSGCGKSTIVQLLERFYSADAGDILIDGTPIADFNIQWLRAQMGLISQEPVLFADSVKYNIEYGCLDPKKKPHWDQGIPMDAPADYVATPEQLAVSPEVVAAATSANAMTFIEKMRFGFATHVGSKGSQLSGGQRQRVAIARAMLRHPKLALCDEATAALDSEGERHVQAALDAMLGAPSGAAAATTPKGRETTSLVIAHRLSTIRDADVIYAMRDGQVVEIGTHDELMAIPTGLYRSLALAQGILEESEDGAAVPGADAGAKQ